MSEAARTPAQIEDEIVRRRQELAATLDEIAVRVHPATMARDARAKAVAAVDRTVGRAYVSANRAVSRVRAEFVTKDGRPRPERIVPAALAAAAVLGLAAGFSARRRRR